MNHQSNRQIPWVQTGAGVLWTARRFPQSDGYAGTNTSYFNFTPQVGIGESVFARKNQSLNFGMRVVECTNLNLGQYNPGVPYVLNFSIGYSWWK
jgi:lipid A 3-O-deacylase